jgi:hypothetical protein
MAPPRTVWLLASALLLACLPQPGNSFGTFTASCSTSYTFMGKVLTFAKCSALEGSAFTVAWTYSRRAKTVTLFFQGTIEGGSPAGWSGFGFSPVAGTKTGADLIVASSDGAGTLTVGTFLGGNATDPNGLTPGVNGLNLDLTQVEVALVGSTLQIYCTLPGVSKLNTYSTIWRGGLLAGNDIGTHSDTSTDKYMLIRFAL